MAGSAVKIALPFLHRRRAMPILIARLQAIAALLVLTLAAAPAAFAHAQLLSTEPAANAVLAEAPELVRLSFNEPVNPLAIGLIAPDGTQTDLTDAAVSGQSMVVHLPAELGQGTHVLSWRVVSVDAHPIAGALVFSIGVATGADVPMIASSRATMLLLWASKAALFAGLFIGIGGAAFALAAPLPAAVRQPVLGFSALGLLATPLSLGLHGADALGLDPDGLLSGAAWSAGFSTSYGITILCLLAAFVLAILAILLPRAKLAALLAWLLAAVALAISGHAGAAEPQWLTRPAVVLHIAGILFWVGALLPLWFWLRERDHAANLALARFSGFIPVAVGALLVSGVTLSVVQLGAPGPAWMTAYGFILGAKLALLLALFALALWNRFKLTGPALAGELPARYRLRQSILVELVLVLAIFGLAAGWRFTPPPRAIAAAEAAQAAASVPLYAHAMDNAVMADLTIKPGRAGPVSIEIFVVDAAGAPLEPQSLDLTLAAPALGIEPFKTSAVLADGVWRVENQTIPLPGVWELILDIRLSRFSLSRIATEIEIP
jgi:copper transport protein